MKPPRSLRLADHAHKLLLTVLVTLFFVGGYFLVGRLTLARARPFPLEFSFERHLPLVPELVYAYLLALVLPDFALFTWPAGDRAGVRRQALSYFVLHVCAFAIFLLYPVRGELRPQGLVRDGLAAQVLGFYYDLDPPVNLFPSLHCGNAVLAALMARRLARRLFLVTAPLCALVLVSVLLVKQHYVADVVAGCLLAMAAERVCFADQAGVGQGAGASARPRG